MKAAVKPFKAWCAEIDRVLAHRAAVSSRRLARKRAGLVNANDNAKLEWTTPDLGEMTWDEYRFGYCRSPVLRSFRPRALPHVPEDKRSKLKTRIGKSKHYAVREVPGDEKDRNWQPLNPWRLSGAKPKDPKRVSEEAPVFDRGAIHESGEYGSQIALAIDDVSDSEHASPNSGSGVSLPARPGESKRDYIARVQRQETHDQEDIELGDSSFGSKPPEPVDPLREAEEPGELVSTCAAANPHRPLATEVHGESPPGYPVYHKHLGIWAVSKAFADELALLGLAMMFDNIQVLDDKPNQKARVAIRWPKSLAEALDFPKFAERKWKRSEDLAKADATALQMWKARARNDRGASDSDNAEASLARRYILARSMFEYYGAKPMKPRWFKKAERLYELQRTKGLTHRQRTRLIKLRS